MDPITELLTLLDPKCLGSQTLIPDQQVEQHPSHLCVDIMFVPFVAQLVLSSGPEQELVLSPGPEQRVGSEYSLSVYVTEVKEADL